MQVRLVYNPKFEITEKQHAALEAYARRNGRAWKTKLSLDWMQSTTLSAELQQLRNNIGPVGLASFRWERIGSA